MTETDRNYVLLFDETITKPDLSYKTVSDLIYRFVDFGQDQRDFKIGNKCGFFMAKGL